MRREVLSTLVVATAMSWTGAERARAQDAPASPRPLTLEYSGPGPAAPDVPNGGVLAPWAGAVGVPRPPRGLEPRKRRGRAALAHLANPFDGVPRPGPCSFLQGDTGALL